MKEVHLVANVKLIGEAPAIYRLYIDDDLITERTFIWDSNTHISENIFATLDPGFHQIRAEPVVLDPALGNRAAFEISDILVDDKPMVLVKNHFKVD